MWKDFVSVIFATIGICLIISSFTAYLEARKALNDTTNPWAINTQCKVQNVDEMNCLHPIVFHGKVSDGNYTKCSGSARIHAPYTAEEVFEEIGKINFSAIPGTDAAKVTKGSVDSSPTVWISKDLGPCTTPGPHYAGCFKTTEMKATLYTRAGQYPLYSPDISNGKRRELINKYGFGHTFNASTTKPKS